MSVCLLLRDRYRSIIDFRLNFRRVLAIDIASDGVARSQNLLDGSLELSGHRLVTHGTGNSDHGIKRDISVVNNVLNLLSVTRGLLQLLHDEGRGSRDNGGGSLNNMYYIRRWSKYEKLVFLPHG